MNPVPPKSHHCNQGYQVQLVRRGPFGYLGFELFHRDLHGTRALRGVGEQLLLRHWHAMLAVQAFRELDPAPPFEEKFAVPIEKRDHKGE